MPQYKIGESIFDVEESRIDEFLNIAKQNNDIPELVEETPAVDPGKKKTPKKPDANAESAPVASNTASFSGAGSLDYGKSNETNTKQTAETTEEDFNPPFASIDGKSYTFTELEAASAKYNLTVDSYLSKFSKSRVDILVDPEQLDEVVVYGEDKGGLIKTYNSIDKKALVASTDPNVLKEARAKIYFGDLSVTPGDYSGAQGTSATYALPTSDFAKTQILKEKLGDKYGLYEQYLKTGSFTLPSFKEDEALTSAAQQSIKSNIFEQELSLLPEGMQNDLKIIANDRLEYKNFDQLNLHVSKTAANIDQRNIFLKQTTESLINSDAYKALESSLADIDSSISMRLKQIKDNNANEDTFKLLNNLIKERSQILSSNSALLSDINALQVLEQRNFKDLSKLKSKISKSSREISDVNLFSSKADLNYNPGARILNSFSSTFVNGVLGASELGFDILSLPLPEDAKMAIKPVKDTLTKLQQGITAEQISVPEANSLLDKVLDNSASIALSLFGASTAGAVARGGDAAAAAKLAQKVTLGGFFVTSAGSDYSQSRAAQINAPIIISSLESKLASGNLSNKEKELTYKEIALQKEIMNYPTIAMASSALFKGATEVVFENLQLNMLGSSVAKNLYNSSLKDLPKLIPGYLKVGGVGVVTNNTQEFFTSLSNNLIDNTKEFFSIQPKYKSLLDGVNKDFFLVNTITGGLTSAVISAPHLVNRLANVGKTERDKTFFLELASEYNKLEEKLLSTADANARLDIQAKQKTIMDRAALYNASLASKLEDLNPTQLDKLFSLHAAEEAIHNQIFTLVSNANMSEDGKKFADQQTQEEFDELNKELNKIATQKYDALNGSSNYNAEYIKKFSAEQLFLKYQDDLGDRVAQLKAGKNNVLILNFNTRPTRQQIKEAVDNFDPSFKEQKLYEQTIDMLYAGIPGVGGAFGVDLQNGKYISNKWLRESIILGENGQDKTQAAFGSVAMFHELLHGFSRSKDSNIDTTLLNKAINEIKENLYNNSVSGSISKENYQIVLDRIQENTKGYADDSARLYEETMQVYEEAVRLGYIKRSDLENNSFGLVDLIGSLRKSAFGALGIGSKVYESTADDIVAHLKSFNEFIATAKALSPPTNEDIAEALLSQGNSVYNKKIAELEEKLLSGQIDYDSYDAQISALDAEIEKAKKSEPKEEKIKVKSTKITEAQQKLNEKVDNLVGPKNESGKYTITKDEWDKGGIKKAYDAIIIGSIIDPLITRGMVGDSIYGKPIEQFIEDVKNGLADLLVRFNPEENNSLIGFINGQLRFRKLDVLNRYKKESGTSSIDVEAGEVGSVQELMSDEDAEFEIFKSEELAKEKEEKIKPNLSDNVRLSEAMSNKLSETMVKAIALNIKKFDEEISKNRTITPFVADFKKDISNLMEQDMISYIRSYGYEQFLKDTREVYLLNLPTSVLSKHPVLRAGIEKRVNGKWTSPTKVGKEKYDWVDENGKKLKIDRDNAVEGRGLTSGPEMIRRNADIVNVVTENMYVDYHFMDGPNRRISKQNPLSSIARQMASEIAIEKVQQDLRTNGPLTKEIAQRAEVVGLLLNEEEIKALDKNFERGLAKLSKTAYVSAIALEDLGVIKAKESLITPIDNYFAELYSNLNTYYGNNYKIDEVFNANFGNLINPKTEDEIKAVNKFKNALRRKANESMLKIQADVLENKISNTSILAKAYGDALTSLVKNDTLKATLELDKFGIGDVLYKSYVTTVFNLTYSFYKKTNSLEDKVEALATAWDLLAPTITKGNKAAGELEETELAKKPKKKVKSNYYENANDFFENHLKEFALSEGIELSINSSQVLYNNKNLKTLSSVNTEFKFIPQTATSRGIDLSKIDSGVFMQTIDPASVVTNLAQRNAQADLYAEKFIDLIAYFADRVKNADQNNKKAALWQLYALMELSKTDMKGMLKVAFPLKYIILDTNTYKEESFVYEHTTPAAELAIDIANLAKEFINNKNYSINKLKIELGELFKNQSVSLTQKSIDDALTKAGLKSSLNKLEGNRRYLTDIIIKLFPNAAIFDLTGEIEGEGGKKYSLKGAKQAGANLSQVSNLDEKGTNAYFNEMLERKKGIAASESISGVTARLEGRGKGRFEIFVPPSAEDFEGMLYYFMGAGEQGDIDRLFFEDKLLIPIAEANYQLNYERQLLKKKYALLIKSNKGIIKKLRQESNYKFYTIDSAVRVYIWDKLRFDIPGLYDKDIIELIKIVEADPSLKKFADQMARFSRKQESWQMPKENWAASTLEYDLQQTLDKVGRKRIFAKFIENKKIIFSEGNLNKIEAAYGTNFRSALEDMLYRIENGKARESGNDRIANAYMNWVRGSVAVTMFFNTRTALLQQLSMVNFTNWEENNPLAQAKAFANTKQWTSDFAMLWNSDWMKERREGLKTDINESELVTAMESSRNKTKALLHWLLTKGFSLTKYGDNFAIATGGAAYYRNRVNMYIKQGLEQAEAEKKAFLDFQEIAERTQQSSRQDLLSNQQVSVAGRLFLAFQNTPMQMTRLTKKAVLDLINNRGSKKANISKILYYSAIQNMVFAFFQNALFAITGLDDEDEEDEKIIDSKTERAINNVLDGVLRGSGIAGGTIATIKNVLIQVKKQEDAGWKGDGAYILLEAANVAPPVGIKARRFYGAYKNYKINKNIIDKVPYSNLNHPLYGIAGSLSGAAFNVPLDRLISKANNVVEASNAEHEAWQRIALFLGYTPYDLGIKDDELARIRKQVKEDKKKSGKKIGNGKSFRVSPVRVKPKRVN